MTYLLTGFDVDFAAFEEFSEIKPSDELVAKFNYCPDCNVPMTPSGTSEYVCNDCGRITQYTADGCKDHSEAVNTCIRICTGANKGRFYNINGDYDRTRKKIISDQLMQNQNNYSGNAFPINILKAAATQYNNIQKIVEDDIGENGEIKGQKKFVRRGNIKDEVLAALIYFECIREKLVRKKKDIAAFMNLPTNGFSRGEDILRTIHAEGKIDIPCDEEEPIEGFVDRYMEALGLEKQNYSDFVVELVMESERKKMGMNSQVSSKIVGAISLIISVCKLNINTQQLERACDNTKKNTFTRFTKLVQNNMAVFGPIFAKHGISG
jgi:hypothetical protein